MDYKQLIKGATILGGGIAGVIGGIKLSPVAAIGIGTTAAGTAVVVVPVAVLQTAAATVGFVGTADITKAVIENIADFSFDKEERKKRKGMRKAVIAFHSKSEAERFFAAAQKAAEIKKTKISKNVETMSRVREMLSKAFSFTSKVTA